MAGNGPVRSLQVGSRLVTGRREQSGIADYRPRDFVINNNAFKARHANHLTSMRHEKYKNSTELAKHVWELKSEGKPLTITWKVREKSRSYRCESKKCNLCTAEKFHILTTPKKLLLNKRSEKVSKCRHENKFRLANFTPIK